MKSARWYVVKCLPDLRRREPRNVGILLDIHGQWYSRYRAQDPVDGTIDGRKLPRGLSLKADAFRAWIEYFDRKAKSNEWEDVMNLPSSRPRRIYVEPGGAIIKEISDPEATLGHLYEEMVDAPLPESDTERMHAAVDRILDAANIKPIRDFEVQADFDGVLRSVQFDMGYQNGQLHLMDTISPGKLTQLNAREMWARMSGVRAAKAANSFFFFYDSSPISESASAEDALSILNRTAHTLDVSDEEEAVHALRENVAVHN